MDADKILLVDDERAIRLAVRTALTREGMQVTEASDGSEALELLKKQQFHLVILDVMMERVGGYEVLQAMRAAGDHTPVMMLSGKSDEMDQVLGLGFGADSYLTKPFHTAVLIQTAKALIRRSRGTSDGTLICGEIRLDTGRMACTVCNTAVKLSPREYDLLLCLLRNRGRVLSREHLLTRVWGWDFEGELRAVDIQIKNLRAALGPAGGQIKTVVKAGYKLEEA